MTSRNERLNEYLRFAETYNSLCQTKKISQLEVLKAFLKLEKSA